ncbi:class I SAM-dependent methyltransferase [Ammoniphilus resinae]|uniref:S-adenosyl-L-methionine-dependent methyltransferase n=1 Tax=Ammoniphilus resinae TaxID=861532 RepID=A0ABS4GRY0_9BACL|nr:class I SAM-dependent methyltransferase [Ammoniphilus resinae]MBP1932782.1 methyltransferase (TIGR00027 family) [Ammoniphilus resinae]
MESKSVTALVSAFSRAYHSMQYTEKIFDDHLAKKIVTEDEYQEIASNMSKGIGFFNPSFVGTPEEALQWIVNQQLSPSPLGRAAFAEKSLESAVRFGARQYLIFAAGYDTFAYRQPDWASQLEIFEIDHPVMSVEKQKRVQKLITSQPENLHFVAADFTEHNLERTLLGYPDFNDNKISFCSLLGISYYLPQQAFIETINTISRLVPKGSSIVFDYPDEYTYTDHAGERVKKQTAMVRVANEEMLASYSYTEIEKLLADNHFLIYEHLTPNEITEQYFEKYNQANPEQPMTAFDHVNYCLAVRK